MLANQVTDRIDTIMCRLLNEDNYNGKRGVVNNKLHQRMKELTVVREFIGKWNNEQVNKADCWLRQNFSI